MISQALLPGPRAPTQISSAEGLRGAKQNVCLALLNMDFHCAYCQSLSRGHWQPSAILSTLFVVGATTHIAPSAQYFHLSQMATRVIRFQNQRIGSLSGDKRKSRTSGQASRNGLNRARTREAQVPGSVLISIVPGHAVISALPLQKK